ncbi:HAD family hydrolase [Haloplanus salinarum]|uniref:HAD family hydrolase n=1 Tax=Haloplanus salinarum TaxID=1912324 RepID=UPI00214B6292|nr:HAD family hydrolase [Haloplanus salinarum]
MDTAAVAFDLDDTLAVTNVDRETLLASALRAVDAPARSREAYLDAHADNLTARSREPVFETLLDGTDVDPAALARAYRERVNEALSPVSGVESMLTRLARRYRLGLLTNGPVVAQRSKLRVLGWSDRFDAALVTGDLSAGKPDAAAFERLLDALDTDAAATVFVGDDVEADVRGASAAGLDAVQVTFPGGPDPDPAAIAHVERDELAARLPRILSSR